RAIALRRVIDDARIALDAPVAVVAEALPRARAQDQCRLAGRYRLGRERAVVVAQWDVPARLAARDSQRFGELEQAVHDVLLRARLEVRVAEIPLVVARAGAIEAEPNLGARREAREIRAHRRVHVQQQRK